MLGAIAGDIIGSIHENLCIKRKDFDLFPKTPESFRKIIVSFSARYGSPKLPNEIDLQ